MLPAEVLGGAIHTFQHLVPNNHTQLYMDFSFGSNQFFSNGLGFEMRTAMGHLTSCGAASQEVDKKPLTPVDVAFFMTAEMDPKDKVAEVGPHARIHGFVAWTVGSPEPQHESMYMYSCSCLSSAHIYVLFLV